MPKRTSIRTPKLDVVQNAFRVVQESVSDIPRTKPPQVTKDMISQVMATMGRKGGKIGGKRRLETLSDTRRSEIASQAAKVRWAKKRKVK